MNDDRYSTTRDEAKGAACARLAYRSKATSLLQPRELAALLKHARQRNAQLGLTGVLLVDGAHFVQWLEGPPEALRAVWRSIERDPRHTITELLAVPPGRERLFADWRMRLACGVDVADARPAWQLQRAVLDGLNGHAALAARMLSALSDAARWPDAPALTQAMLSMSQPDGALTEQALAADATTVDTLEAQVLDPVNRLLGQRWAEDRCSQADLVIAQGCLMSWAHRMMPPAPEPDRGAAKVLVSLLPGEPHLAGVTLAAWAHQRAGALVDVVFPRTPQELCGLLRGRRHDVLQLCSSDILAREERWPDMAAVVAQARRASIEPRMAVLLRGRAFTDQPGLGLLLGADDSFAAGGMDRAALTSLLRWCRARVGSPAMMVAQATLIDVASHLYEQRFDARAVAAR
jgi:Sensors of blue-light using FAD